MNCHVMPAMDVDQLDFPRLDISKQKGAASATPLRKVEDGNGDIAVIKDPAATTGGSRRSKQVKSRKKRTGGMAPAAAATNVVRGFETPTTPFAEELDISRGGSPLLRAASYGIPMSRQGSNQSGISLLKARLDNLALEEANNNLCLTRSNSMLGSELGGSQTSAAGSNSDKTEMDTYEVNLEHDFVSPDADAKISPRLGPVEGGLRTSSIHRKMTSSDFRTLRCLGKGAFGTVYLVKQHATGRLYAQKQFRKASLTVHKRLVEQTRTERAILESVNRHPFVVKLFYAFQDHEKLYLILEYALGGELFTHLQMERMFSEETAAFYMAEMVLALEHLHLTVSVVYRDLKPENCLLDSEGHLLLTDFGLSKVAVEDERCNSVLGTIEYMAPEVIQGLDYGMAVDWWSLGAIGFDMLTGSPPFQGGNNAKIQQNILKQKLQLPYFLGPDAKDLLTRLLRKEQNKRLGSKMPQDLQTIKDHRFFRKIDWRRLEARECTPPIRPLITDPELAENFAKEFTDLPVRPSSDGAGDGAARTGGLASSHSVTCGGGDAAAAFALESDPFGGFSFVASSSMLGREPWMMEGNGR